MGSRLKSDVSAGGTELVDLIIDVSNSLTSAVMQTHSKAASHIEQGLFTRLVECLARVLEVLT